MQECWIPLNPIIFIWQFCMYVSPYSFCCTSLSQQSLVWEKPGGWGNSFCCCCCCCCCFCFFFFRKLKTRSELTTGKIKCLEQEDISLAKREQTFTCLNLNGCMQLFYYHFTLLALHISVKAIQIFVFCRAVPFSPCPLLVTIIFKFFYIYIHGIQKYVYKQDLQKYILGTM